MPIQKLKDFLDKHKVRYVSIKHSPVYTTQETAQAAHIPAKDIAKVVIVKIDGELAMVVMPGNMRLDMRDLREALDSSVKLATEDDFQGRFPGCEIGAMPPFGNLYEMDVYTMGTLPPQIAFNAGTHLELIQLGLKDYLELVRPIAL
ncbi:MAG: YbaK/EbsC family protein [Deltaproteobacteria bacterium]|nr:YbaK/EbsC family protein [Deltaproteobacteria bacterium]